MGGFLSGKPDVSAAAKMGPPAMTILKPPVPVSVPAIAAGITAPGGISDVVAGVVGDTANLDQQNDARLNPQPGATSSAVENKASVGSNGQPIAADSPATPAAPAAPDATLPTNHPASAKQLKDFEKAQKRAEVQAKKKLKKAPAQPAPNPAAKP